MSQDTKHFISVSEDGTVKLWSFEDVCIASSGVVVENGKFVFNAMTLEKSVFENFRM